jgi:hypothetical protein
MYLPATVLDRYARRWYRGGTNEVEFVLAKNEKIVGMSEAGAARRNDYRLQSAAGIGFVPSGDE